jgi:HlyD family secretion protein
MNLEINVPVGVPKKRIKKRKAKSIIIPAIIAVILVGGGFLLWKYILTGRDEKGNILTDIAVRGTIQSKVEGSGITKAKDTAAITLAASGTVAEVYVTEGQFVTKGQKLYKINSQAAEEAVYIASQTLQNRQKELDALNKELSELTIRAPFSGQLQDITSFEIGETVAKGTKIATLVDDSKFKLTLYFSYAYKNNVYAGQPVQVSIPSAMAVIEGKIEKIDYVRRVAPGGTVLFQAVAVVDNPGVLTEGVEAYAVLKAADGSSVYPFSSATTEYYRKTVITAKASGPVEENNLLNYADVAKGEVLLVLGSEDIESLILAKQKEVDTAQEKLDEAQKALDNVNAVAPISGTVVSCPLAPGMEVSSGQTAITISDTSVMTVEIQVDERNVGYVKPGMEVDIDQWGNIYKGVVESVSLQGNAANGMATFPAVVKVDNSGGGLMTGMYVTYSFVASQSDNCLVVPIQCVRYVNDETGTPVTVVFLKADRKPDDAINLGEEAKADIPEGFYAVPVKTGLSDIYNIEIIEGLNDGDVVFTNYETDQGDSFQRGVIIR